MVQVTGYIHKCLPVLLHNAAKLLCSDGAVMFDRATVAANAEGEYKVPMVGGTCGGCLFGSGNSSFWTVKICPFQSCDH